MGSSREGPRGKLPESAPRIDFVDPGQNPESCGVGRGTPPTAEDLRRMNPQYMLEGFEEAERISARLRAVESAWSTKAGEMKPTTPGRGWFQSKAWWFGAIVLGIVVLVLIRLPGQSLQFLGLLGAVGIAAMLNATGRTRLERQLFETQKFLAVLIQQKDPTEVQTLPVHVNFEKTGDKEVLEALRQIRDAADSASAAVERASGVSQEVTDQKTKRDPATGRYCLACKGIGRKYVAPGKFSPCGACQGTGLEVRVPNIEEPPDIVGTLRCRFVASGRKKTERVKGTDALAKADILYHWKEEPPVELGHEDCLLCLAARELGGGRALRPYEADGIRVPVNNAGKEGG